MALVFTVAQQKGGSGKTTLAAQIAVAWAKRGHAVAAVDIDPQASLAAWGAERERAPSGTVPLTLRGLAGWKLATELDRLKREHDMVVVDSPPHAETDAHAAVRAADLALVPVQPSPMDLWAIGPTLAIARSERVPWRLVLNRVPARGRMVETARAHIADQGLAAAGTTLGNRTAFARSLMQGRGVVESEPRSAAAREIDALAAELENPR